MTTLETLDVWLVTPENEHLDFKEAAQQYDTTKLFRYCVAFANEGGGHFILGVTDKLPESGAATVSLIIANKRGEVD